MAFFGSTRNILTEIRFGIQTAWLESSQFYWANDHCSNGIDNMKLSVCWIHFTTEITENIIAVKSICNSISLRYCMQEVISMLNNFLILRALKIKTGQ